MPQHVSKLDREIATHVETLEAMYFLVQHLEENYERLQGIASFSSTLPRASRFRLRDELRDEVRWVKDETGGIAADGEYRDLCLKIRAYEGYYYLDKLYIERALFTNYRRVFPRWPYIKDHAAVLFDGKKRTGMGQIFELEGQCLRDARELHQRAIQAEKGIQDFRKRTDADQMEVLMFARAALLALLGEWSTEKKRHANVDFRSKVFRYPVIVGRTRGLKVDLSGCNPAHALIDYAKDFRDALVHPSPFIDPKTGEQSKFLIQVGVNARIAGMVLADAVAYAEAVEKAIGNDPMQSAPWLFEKAELKGAVLAKAERSGSGGVAGPRRGS
jgi:hypothetical protein